MPLKYFICNDGEIRATSECLEHCPVPVGRCLSLPTLHTIARIRKWTGTPSTTQCLNPTRIEYLQIKYDYALNPFEQAFALLGTRHHSRLESIAQKLEGLKSELPLSGEVSGILDLLEPINGSDNYRLIDYKTYGSYAVAKHLGLKEHNEYDRYHLALQLNNYRLMAQELGFNIVELKVQITVRDGGTWVAKNNGIDGKLYLLPVDILPDDEISLYFTRKAKMLKRAIEYNLLPDMCDYEERWAGNRCKGYCPVFMFCPEGAKINKVQCEA